MQKEDIERIVAKYRKLAGSTHDEEKMYQYEHFAKYIEENRNIFEEDDHCETEDDFWYPYIETLTLLELERLLKELSKELEANREKIEGCLGKRKHILTQMFKCTSENIERLHCVANLIKDNTEMLHKKGNELYEETCKLWQAGKNKPFTDFRVEISVKICFNDEETSVFPLDDNDSGSDYVQMAKLLYDFYRGTYSCGNLITWDSIDYDIECDDLNEKKIFEFIDYDGKVDDWAEPWFFEQFPELQGLPVVMEFHDLLFHCCYALQDIIRINDIECEAKVEWQHLTRHDKKS